MNDFSTGEAKIDEKQSRQSNSKYNLTLCNMYFSKKVYAVYNAVWGCRSCRICDNFCVKSN